MWVQQSAIHLGPDEALIAVEGHGAAKQELVPEPLAVHRHPWVVALILAEGWGERHRYQLGDACPQYMESHVSRCLGLYMKMCIHTWRVICQDGYT